MSEQSGGTVQSEWQDPAYCRWCGVGPSRYMLGCCDDCSQRITKELATEDV